MTIQAWTDMSILVEGLEVAGHGKDVNLLTEVAPLDTTGLSTTGWMSFVGGLKSGSVDMTLMSDMAEGSVDDVFWAQLGAGDTVKSVVTNSADGSVGYLFRGLSVGHSVGGSVGELAAAKLTGKSSTGPVVRGRLLHPGSASRSTSDVGTGRQLGAVVSGKSLYAALHVLSVSGTSTPTLTVKVQSDDNSGFTSATDRITFTGATAVGAQWGSVAGAVTDDYWRVTWTISGTTPVFAFAVVAGIL